MDGSRSALNCESLGSIQLGGPPHHRRPQQLKKLHNSVPKTRHHVRRSKSGAARVQWIGNGGASGVNVQECGAEWVCLAPRQARMAAGHHTRRRDDSVAMLRRSVEIWTRPRRHAAPWPPPPAIPITGMAPSDSAPAVTVSVKRPQCRAPRVPHGVSHARPAISPETAHPRNSAASVTSASGVPAGGHPKQCAALAGWIRVKLDMAIWSPSTSCGWHCELQTPSCKKIKPPLQNDETVRSKQQTGEMMDGSLRRVAI